MIQKSLFLGKNEEKLGRIGKKWGNMLSWATAILLEAPYAILISCNRSQSNQEIRNLVVAMPGANGSDAAEYLRGWDLRDVPPKMIYRFCGTCHAQDH